MSVTLELTAQEFEFIMTVLGHRPFMEVHALMQKLVAQANAQRVNEPANS